MCATLQNLRMHILLSSWQQAISAHRGGDATFVKPCATTGRWAANLGDSTARRPTNAMASNLPESKSKSPTSELDTQHRTPSSTCGPRNELHRQGLNQVWKRTSTECKKNLKLFRPHRVPSLLMVFTALSALSTFLPGLLAVVSSRGW